MINRREITLKHTIEFIETQLATQYAYPATVSEDKISTTYENFQNNVKTQVHQAIAEFIKENPFTDILYINLKNKKYNDFMMKTYLFEILPNTKSPFSFFTIFFSLIQDMHSQLNDEILKKEFIFEMACLLHDFARSWAEQYKNWHTAILTSLNRTNTFEVEVITAKNLLKSELIEIKAINTLTTNHHAEKKPQKSETLKYLLYGAGILVAGLGLFALSKKMNPREITSIGLTRHVTH